MPRSKSSTPIIKPASPSIVSSAKQDASPVAPSTLGASKPVLLPASTATPDGAFSFRTIVPAVYTGRTRHYHVKVQAPGSRLLTTQLYFPKEPANARDGLFSRDLLMRVADVQDGLTGRFDFVLDTR